MWLYCHKRKNVSLFQSHHIVHLIRDGSTSFRRTFNNIVGSPFPGYLWASWVLWLTLVSGAGLWALSCPPVSSAGHRTRAAEGKAQLLSCNGTSTRSKSKRSNLHAEQRTKPPSEVPCRAACSSFTALRAALRLCRGSPPRCSRGTDAGKGCSGWGPPGTSACQARGAWGPAGSWWEVAP